MVGVTTDGEGVTVGVLPPGEGVTVGVLSPGKSVAVGSAGDGVSGGESVGGCVGGGSVGGCDGPGVGVRVGTVHISCNGGIAQAVGITAKVDSANVMSNHPINIHRRLFIIYLPKLFLIRLATKDCT